MNDSAHTSRVLIIAGMHRSGTSLTAKWLAHCGLHVGDELLQRETDNPTGHYEDLTFLAFHENLLRDNGTDFLVNDHTTCTIKEDYWARGRTLVAARSQHKQWGWKDPRTTLFLDFWHTLLPQVKVLGVYRHYVFVVDSLLRRAYQRALRHQNLNPIHYRLLHSRKLALLRRIPGLMTAIKVIERTTRRVALRLTYSYWNFRLLRRYLLAWQRYNRDLLAFAETHPEHTIMLHIDDVLALGNNVIDHMNHLWGFDLRPTPIETVFVDGMLTIQPKRFQTFLLGLLAPGSHTILDALAHCRDRTREKLTRDER